MLGAQVEEFARDTDKDASKSKLNAFYKAVVKGTLVVAADSHVFSRVRMGELLRGENAIPRGVDDIVYRIFEEKFDIRPTMTMGMAYENESHRR